LFGSRTVRNRDRIGSLFESESTGDIEETKYVKLDFGSHRKKYALVAVDVEGHRIGSRAGCDFSARGRIVGGVGRRVCKVEDRVGVHRVAGLVHLYAQARHLGRQTFDTNQPGGIHIRLQGHVLDVIGRHRRRALVVGHHYDGKIHTGQLETDAAHARERAVHMAAHFHVGHVAQRRARARVRVGHDKTARRLLERH